MKEIPISKIYEALSAVADERIEEKDQNTFLVTSSDHTKKYTVILNGKSASSNDNATYWQHYAGYPIIAVFLYRKEIPFDNTLLRYFRNIPWKKLNTENKNDYDKSIEQAFHGLEEKTRKEIQEETTRIRLDFLALGIMVKGNRKSLVPASLH